MNKLKKLKITANFEYISNLCVIRNFQFFLGNLYFNSNIAFSIIFSFENKTFKWKARLTCLWGSSLCQRRRAFTRKTTCGRKYRITHWWTSAPRKFTHLIRYMVMIYAQRRYLIVKSKELLRQLLTVLIRQFLFTVRQALARHIPWRVTSKEVEKKASSLCLSGRSMTSSSKRVAENFRLRWAILRYIMRVSMIWLNH